MKYLYAALTCILLFTANAGTIYVTNTNDSGPGSLRETINAANDNDIIHFPSTLLNGGSLTITLESEIEFSKPLEIIGLYNSTDTLYISGGNTNRHFNITNAGNVTLESMVLINGKSYDSGGSIRVVDLLLFI